MEKEFEVKDQFILEPATGNNENNFARFVNDLISTVAAVQNSKAIYTNKKAYNADYMPLPDFQKAVNPLCHQYGFVLSESVYVNSDGFMCVDISLLHNTGYSYNRHYSFFNVPHLMLKDIPGNNKGIHQYNGKNQLDYTSSVSMMATSSQRRALFAFFNIHPDAPSVEEPNMQGNWNAPQEQNYNQSQQQGWTHPVAPNAETALPDNVSGNVALNTNLPPQQPVTQPQTQQQGEYQQAQPPMDQAQTQQAQPQVQTQPQAQPATMSVDDIAQSFNQTNLARYVWGGDDKADGEMLGAYMHSIGIADLNDKARAWNAAIAVFGDPTGMTGVDKINVYWQIANHIRESRTAY